MQNSGMLAAVAAAAKVTTEDGKPIEVNAAFIKQHFGAVAAELTAEGTQAERDRIIGIEAAAMPGHEDIIKTHKADSAKTPADAALAVIAAEKGKLAAMDANLDKDEKKLKGLKAVATDTPEKPKRSARQMAEMGKEYIAAQAAKGIIVSAAQAIQHIETQEG